MRVMGPEGEVLENKGEGRKPGEQREGRKPGEQRAGKEDWGTRRGRGRRICTFSNMMSLETNGVIFWVRKLFYDLKPLPRVFFLFFLYVMGSEE